MDGEPSPGGLAVLLFLDVGQAEGGQEGNEVEEQVTFGHGASMVAGMVRTSK